MATSKNAELRVAVIGVGLMGADHVARLTDRISGAQVTVISDYSPARAAEVAAGAPGARVVDNALDAIADPDVDAVLLATPGPAHAEQLHACLDVAKPVLCEKPMTTDVHSSLELVRREQSLGRKLIQVGFMRRFDPEYRQLKQAIDAGDFGAPLLLHCAHRNPAVPVGFDSAMMVRDSLVHEVDSARFLLGEEITAITVHTPTSNSQAPAGLRDPQLTLFETESGRLVTAEVFVTTGVGYEVRTELVGEKGSATIGSDVGLVRKNSNGTWGGRITANFKERFAEAYDEELRAWVAAVRRGFADGGDVFIAGPGSWDGYAATAVCEAGVRALESGQRVAVELADQAAPVHDDMEARL
ncbi:Gfo/Idh/MocA family oxidoreductase [Nocardia sp. NBC_00565]|uniref:Gfo/Idh/MocA family protein n=1 Tax=Nocardia sp. NBC_00565 TaxID=2975993 RepID=UPI002E823E55|nr:Gfo/Idh/MocA family oxidoreductase [Nocardia sp. NBC_00565]WUC07254.1 Gfo/Idh/MocA family oxidoreductase [Nocardia sp. NBC_00565]